MFGAFRGLTANGEDYIDAAVAAGAVAVVARPEAAVSGAAHIADAEPRRAFACLAARFFAPKVTEDYRDMMELARGVIQEAADAAGGGRRLTHRGQEIDLDGDWSEVTMRDAVRERLLERIGTG